MALAPTTAPPAAVIEVAPATTSWSTYVVRPGDTLWAIARRTGTTTAALIARNALSNHGNLILVGQRLQVPGAAAATASTPVRATTSTTASRSSASPTTTAATVHLVRSGDTLSALAARYRTTVSAIASLNSLANPNLIRVGQRLTIRPATTNPATQARSTATTSSPATPAPAKAAAELPPVSGSVATNRKILASTPVPTQAQTKALIIKIATAHGVDPALALAVGWQESGWNQRAVSGANAIGVMQVIPSSGQWAAQLVGRPLNLLDPTDNVTAGVAILRALLRSADNREQAIAGYYQGLTSVRSRGLYADTAAYVRNVLALARTF